jgi:hypothetical protein
VEGDSFSNISHATIINRSSVLSAFNRLQADGKNETAEALQKIAEAIEKSGNKEAGEQFGAMTDELNKPQPSKAILKTLWSGVTQALPTILNMTDLVAKITGLFT